MQQAEPDAMLAPAFYLFPHQREQVVGQKGLLRPFLVARLTLSARQADLSVENHHHEYLAGRYPFSLRHNQFKQKILVTLCEKAVVFSSMILLVNAITRRVR
jgi:hypothetical protein